MGFLFVRSTAWVLVALLALTAIRSSHCVSARRHTSTCRSQNILHLEHSLQLADGGDVFTDLAKLYAEATWLVIGANTVTNNGNDPSVKYLEQFKAWRKVFVEPVPWLYQKLQQNVGPWPNTKTINAAISGDPSMPESIQPIWCLSDFLANPAATQESTQWHSQICSFDKKHFARHYISDDKVVGVNVTTYSVPYLLEKHALQDIQMLLVDVEGLDWQVLKHYPFETSRPAVIVFEHIHLSADDLELSRALLRKHCYVTFKLKGDNTFALRIIDG